MNARANKRRVMDRFYGRFHAHFVWQSDDKRLWLNVAPVGREFGSPDYERLSILDLYAKGAIDDMEAMERLGLDRIALEAMEGQDGLTNTKAAYAAAHKIVSSLADVPAYELDGGPLTARNLAEIRQDAAK